jgi:predicted amidophosphoribosyltransferase
MAFIRDEFCYKCNKTSSHVNGRCSDCFEKSEKERIKQWESQTLEEKLTNIRERLETLERPITRIY